MNSKNKLGIVLFLIGIFYMAFVSYIGFTKMGLWYDEIYSLGMVKSSLNEIVGLTVVDVHPPAYYFIYKIFLKILPINAVSVGKFVSLLPFYLLIILSATKIRKNFGMLTAGLFTLCICSMPQLMSFAVELRMYGWGLFFVTTTLVYMHDIIKQRDSNKTWIAITVLTILSAYTHYFSAVASFVLYLFLLIYIISKDRTKLKKWLTSAAVAVLLFIPWITITLKQISTISGDYWIAPITIERAIGFIWFGLSPQNQIISGNEIADFSILGLLIIISILVLIFKSKNRFGKIGILIAVCVPLIGIIISFIVRPFFHPRYMIPALGCLWLGFSVLLASKYDNKAIFIPILVIILITGFVGAVNFDNNQNYELTKDIQTNQTIHGAIKSGSVVLFDHFNPYFEYHNYRTTDNWDISLPVANSNNFNSTVDEIDKAINDKSINKTLHEGSKLYLVSYKKYNDSIILENDNFVLKNITMVEKRTIFEIILKN